MAYQSPDKIHYTQLSKDIKSSLRSTVSAFLEKHTLSFLPHAVEKMTERNISPCDVLNVLPKHSIVEFKNTNNAGNDFRVLLRCHTPINGRNYCAVVSLTKKLIVTVYSNDKDDHHDTIDMKAYDSRIDVARHLKSIRF